MVFSWQRSCLLYTSGRSTRKHSGILCLGISPLSESSKKFKSCVLPGVLEENAKRDWRQRTLIVVDFPALDLPANAISGSSVSGSPISSETDITNRAESKRALISDLINNLRRLTQRRPLVGQAVLFNYFLPSLSFLVRVPVTAAARKTMRGSSSPIFFSFLSV